MAASKSPYIRLLHIQQEIDWMLEELRISLFAQQLKTAGPVSVQRIQKALAE